MNVRILGLLCSSLVILSGCRFWDNSTTFFNTYYNQKKLMAETEDEFGYNDYLKPPKPRIIAPREPDIALEKASGELPKYVSDMIIKPVKLQPVQVKVDSIIIKGSKILATHPKSTYVDGSLYLMAKAFFYRSEWLPSNIKCMELAEQFPNSQYSPDAHLLSAKNYLIQRNMPKAKIMLSRTVDVAWQQERYDVLSEAFQLMAEAAVEEEDYDAAERPYRQAISQCTDEGQRAKWQTDLGLILYRLRFFEKAEKELAKVQEYSPNYITEFEAKYYRALSLAQLKHFDEANALLDKMEHNRNFDEYGKLGYMNAARMEIVRLQGNKDALEAVEKTMDSAGGANAPMLVSYFERGLELFRAKDYENARKYFAKAKVVRSPVFDGANTLFNLLNTREQKMQEAETAKAAMHSDDTPSRADSLKTIYAKNIFELGRTHELMGNKDSAEKYYNIAMNSASDTDTLRAQYLFSYARMVEPRNRDLSDSVHEVIFGKYRTTQYGLDSRIRLGYTDYAVLDSVEEIYRSGTRFRSVGDFPMALKQFLRVSEDYSASKYAPASLYAVGWIWERKLVNNDSALFYYAQLMKRYPFSEYADDVHYAVAYSNARHGDGDTTGLSPWGGRLKPNEQKDKSTAPPSANPPSTPASSIPPDPNSKNFPIPSARPPQTDLDSNPQILSPVKQPMDSTMKVAPPPSQTQPIQSDTVTKKPK